METSVHAESQIACGELTRFELQLATARIGKGVVGGLTLVFVLAVWGVWTGRFVDDEVIYFVIKFGCVLSLALFIVLKLFARTWARAGGVIEVDSQGIRWRRGDGTIGFESLWDTVHNVTIDRRNRQVLLEKNDHTNLLINPIDGYLELARFAEFEQQLASRVNTKQHCGALDRATARAAARRATFYGAVCMLESIALYGANLALGALLHWTRLQSPFPLVVAGAGLITLVGSLRFWFGRGPMVSPIYSPGYPQAMVRFLVVAAVGDVVVMAMANWLHL